MLFKHWQGVLRNADPNPGGGGGTPPPALTLDQVNEVVTRALSGITTQLAEKFTALETGITEKLKGATPPAPPPNPEKKETAPELPKDMAPELRALFESQSAQLKEFEKRLATQQKEAETEREKARVATINAGITEAVSSIKFADDAARNVFLQVVKGAATLDNNGKLIADRLPIADYVKREIAKLPGLVAAQAPSGSGSGAGAPPGGVSHDINFKMSDDDYRARAADIARQLNG